MSNSAKTIPKPTFSEINAAATVEAQCQLLDLATKRLKLKNDAALARALEVAPPVISKIRHDALDIGAMLAVNIHETAGISIAEIKAVLAGRAAA
jgi:hypothetical protein